MTATSLTDAFTRVDKERAARQRLEQAQQAQQEGGGGMPDLSGLGSRLNELDAARQRLE